jgi:hypothetical protein
MYMCSTPWCYGECDECKAEEAENERLQDSIAECPHRKECNWVTVNVKADRCTTCGQTFTYP